MPKVEFRVNGDKKNYAMKLGEGGEAFFVFETSDAIPESLQTSPVISPAASPQSLLTSASASPSSLQEPEYLDLNLNGSNGRRPSVASQPSPMLDDMKRAKSYMGPPTPEPKLEPSAEQLSFDQKESGHAIYGSAPVVRRSASEELFPLSSDESRLENAIPQAGLGLPLLQTSPNLPGIATPAPTDRSVSPPPISISDAVTRAKNLSQKLSGSNIPTRVTDSGDLMLDMTGFKSSEEDALRAEVVARKILAEELEGNYDIGALIGADEHGNLWIYSSEEAKEEANRKSSLANPLATSTIINDAASDPGYQSDEEQLSSSAPQQTIHHRSQSDAVQRLTGVRQDPESDNGNIGDPNRNFAKTLRLTSDQLKALDLKPGPNAMSFSVNRATCQAYMHYWKYDVPIVISDIDGTITK